METETTSQVQIMVNPKCDGGYVPCDVHATWAFKINPEDSWLYACGRHLTASMTEETAGEQAEFIVRRIKTEGC